MDQAARVDDVPWHLGLDGTSSTHVLLVDDDPDMMRWLRSAPHLKDEIVATSCPTVDEAASVLAHGSIHVILLSVTEDEAASGVVARLHTAAPHVPIVVLGMALREETARRLVREGAQDCLDKSLADTALLARALHYAIERHHSKERLIYLATHDVLTGLPNRALLNDRLDQVLALAGRHHLSPALLVIDLDAFKDVNDTLGHHCGDVLLHTVAMRLQDVLRDSDTVARLGGDEFAVLLHDSDQETVLLVAQRIVDALTEPMIVPPHTLALGCSIGISLAPAHGTDAASLLQHADVAMYVAKRSGGGFAVYVPDQDDHSSSRLALGGELRRAITEGELVLHYQPLVDILHGHLMGIEALVRWQHPERGLLGPDQFVSLAEKTGLITPLTVWVLETAIAQSKAWERDGLYLETAVNISRRTLHHSVLPRTIAEVLARHAYEPSRLILEITEGALMAEMERVEPVLGALTRLGVRLAIDDFGMGHSSLASLRRMPVDVLKIDKSFLMQIAAGSDHDTSIVAYTIGLGHALGLTVVCEGVETQEVWDLLAGLGCDQVQGFHLSRPLPAAAFEAWVAGEPWAAITGHQQGSGLIDL